MPRNALEVTYPGGSQVLPPDPQFSIPAPSDLLPQDTSSLMGMMRNLPALSGAAPGMSTQGPDPQTLSSSIYNFGVPAASAALGGPAAGAISAALPPKTPGEAAGQLGSLGLLKYLPAPLQKVLGKALSQSVAGGASYLTDRALKSKIDKTGESVMPSTLGQGATMAANMALPLVAGRLLARPAAKAEADKYLGSLTKNAELNAQDLKALENEKVSLGQRAEITPESISKARTLAVAAAQQKTVDAKRALDAIKANFQEASQKQLPLAKKELASAQDAINNLPQTMTAAEYNAATQRLNTAKQGLLDAQVKASKSDALAAAQKAFYDAQDYERGVRSGSIMNRSQQTLTQNANAQRLAANKNAQAIMDTKALGSEINDKLKDLQASTDSKFAGIVKTALLRKMAYAIPGGLGITVGHGDPLKMALGAGASIAIMGWDKLATTAAKNPQFGDQLSEWMRNGASLTALKSFPAVQNALERGDMTIKPTGAGTTGQGQAQTAQ